MNQKSFKYPKTISLKGIIFKLTDLQPTETDFYHQKTLPADSNLACYRAHHHGFPMELFVFEDRVATVWYNPNPISCFSDNDQINLGLSDKIQTKLIPKKVFQLKADKVKNYRYPKMAMKILSDLAVDELKKTYPKVKKHVALVA